MGLIQALKGAAESVIADQWKEYFVCDAMSSDVLMTRGYKKISGRSSNTKSEDNIITSGSIIAVAPGQCMIITDQGRVAEVCAEPGAFQYDSSTEPSILAGGLNGETLKGVFANIGKRFTFGGDAPKDQRVYYINTKEILGNKYGTPSPIPYRVVDTRAGIDTDIAIKCFGEYSYKITNPILFFNEISSTVTYEYRRETLDSQLKSELLTALNGAFARISEMGIRYSALPGHCLEIADALNEELSAKWRDRRGIEIAEFGVSSVKASEEDEALIKEMQREATYMDPTRAAAASVLARNTAMKDAANNTAGAMTGFMGMGMMGQAAGNVDVASLYAMGQANQAAQPAPVPAAPARPVADAWTCKCGAYVTGNFCPECGSKKETASGWTCTCGSTNTGKFCSNCGAKKPAAAFVYKCDKCGWTPEDPSKPPKFCPECGDPFDENDIVQ